MSEEQATVPDVEAEAKLLGWVPLEEWKSDPAHWVDAETFAERGRQVLPIVSANNKVLKQQVNALQAQLQGVTQQLKDAAASIESMKAFQIEAVKQATERAREATIAEIATARENGDVRTEVSLTSKLAKLDAAEAKFEAKAPDAAPPAKGPDEVTQREFTAWQSQPQNQWFGTDNRKTALALAIAAEMRQDSKYNGLAHGAFYDAMAAEVEKTFNRPAGESKVSGGGQTGGSAGGGAARGKTYASMTREMREACDYQEPKMVGPGKPFKTVAEWRTHYATLMSQMES